MTTVVELIEYLETLPQEAVVEVLVEASHGYSVYTTHTPIDLSNTDVLDFTNKPGCPFDGKVFIQLNGEQ